MYSPCIVIILLPAVFSPISSVQFLRSSSCGGRLQNPAGVIQTPNFPGPFTVPIRCRWIIEQNSPNGTISVYFSQQYTTSGLTFTEYMYYDDTYKLGERRALSVTDENITRIKWLQVQSPVLVVELSLDRLEGTQLRALGLLSVFGFNMTYNIRRANESPPPSCTAIECRLLGHCYASSNYRDFFCSCFEGYSGVDCGLGPLCAASSNMCKNGGTCRQLGPAAVSCICAAGYTGDLCEVQIAEPACSSEECGRGCSTRDRKCDCNPRESDDSSARFETRLQITAQPSENVSQVIRREITSYLKTTNITLEDDIEILNASNAVSSAIWDVWVRMWCDRRDAGDLKSALSRWTVTHARHVTNTLQVQIYPALSLQTLTVNQRPDIWEGSEYILSCMAYGSSDTIFTWFKDGVEINFNGTTRDIWTRIVSEDALGRRMSVLGISEAQRVDTGRWSCSAEDGGRKRCRSLHLTILSPPEIRLLPTTVTINKGDNISITCLAGGGRTHGALGFSWARDQTLLPLEPGSVIWEDLYPAGSVLKLFNVQKSGEYRCQVTSAAGTNSEEVSVWTLGVHDEACEADASFGLRWHRTAPGAYASGPCPTGLVGETTRFCEPKTANHDAKWKLPDFSKCVADLLKNMYDQFKLIFYGYSWKTVASIAKQYSKILRSLPAVPGGGTIPAQHAKAMLDYLLSPVGKAKDRNESSEYLYQIYDTLLKHPDSFLDEEKIYDLQNDIVRIGGMQENIIAQYEEFNLKATSVREGRDAHFQYEAGKIGFEEWLLESVGVELIDKNGKGSVVSVIYYNLASRLPSLQQAVEFRDSREMEYKLSSQHVQVYATGDGIDSSQQHLVSLLFANVHNQTATATKLACASRTISDPRSWSTKSCDMKILETAHVMCRCRGFGTFAVLTVARATMTSAEKDLHDVVIIAVRVGASLCLAVTVLQLFNLVSGCESRIPIFLKVATAGTHAVALFLLLECDTTQEFACPGTLGWVIAACWCAGCAALCAQPLLLHAELTNTQQGPPSVSLLAGFCIITWLTARLWGGAPLHLGSAAQVVSMSGCVLLTFLCLVLTFWIALRLRIIRKKINSNGRSYYINRNSFVSDMLILIIITSLVQSAELAYVQPGERDTVHVATLSATAIATGIAMIVCYVIRDDACLRSVKRALSITPNSQWQNSPNGDTSLSLYFKQSGEVESRSGAVVDVSSLQTSPESSYWKTPSKQTMYRRQSLPDNRADIVKCVEYENKMLNPHTSKPKLYKRNGNVCDLIPHCREKDYTDFMQPNKQPIEINQETCKPRSITFNVSKELCTLCAQSNPDVSAISTAPCPAKSCLKKTNVLHCSCTSLPSIEVKEERIVNLKQVNKEWNETYSPETENVVNKISSDLNFLLNRSLNCENVEVEVDHR